MLTVPRGADAPARVSLGVCCWPEVAPYRPEVSLELRHTGSALHLRFTVDECSTAARETADGSAVWLDSCVEAFFDFGEPDGGYYNIEANCIGTVLACFRRGRELDVCPAPPELVAAIGRRSSLPHVPLAETELGAPWQLELAIPAATFFRSGISDFSGLRARANFYKCGDGLRNPHYMAWQAVHSPEPNFHRPQDFGEIGFEV
ncbi:MAG: carbohydrate-binding family 9-like protein [Muribaculaceae bacterium]|nr:carbohydrate-binding family 9-like protein [Muribaculaceae bacterium]